MIKCHLLALAVQDRGHSFWRHENIVIRLVNQDIIDYFAEILELPDQVTVMTMQMEITEQQYEKLCGKLG